MKKKLLIPLLVFTLLFATSITAFAYGESFYNQATNFIQVGEYRIYMVYGSGVKNNKVYAVKMNDGSLGLYTTYGTLSGYFYSKEGGEAKGIGSFQESNPFSSIGKLYKITFPLTIGDSTFTTFDHFRSRVTGNGFFYVTEESGTLENAVDFFKNPLLEAVKELQGGTVQATQIIKDSYLVYLVPCGIGLLALLVALPTLKKVLFRFLPL